MGSRINAETDLQDAFQDLADWAADSSPLYAAICRAATRRDVVRETAARAPADRTKHVLFLAAVHALLRDGLAHPLAAYYPSVSDDPRPPDDALGDHLADFCSTHGDTIADLMQQRRTQTNAVERCAALFPAFTQIASVTDGPLALVEIGPSAGLNLRFDAYRYDYGDRTGGDPSAPVTIETELRRGDPPLSTDPPRIHSRVGVDLHPLDVTEEADRAWLEALIWPEHYERRSTLQAAMAAARQDPPRLVGGDIRTELGDILESIPQEIPVVVFDTLVLYQLSEGPRDELEARLRGLAAERELHWLAGEDEYGDHEGIRLEWTRSVGGEVRTDLLAGFDPHCAWLEWCHD
jgi:hypothetical protein